MMVTELFIFLLMTVAVIAAIIMGFMYNLAYVLVGLAMLCFEVLYYKSGN